MSGSDDFAAKLSCTGSDKKEIFVARSERRHVYMSLFIPVVRPFEVRTS